MPWSGVSSEGRKRPWNPRAGSQLDVPESPPNIIGSTLRRDIWLRMQCHPSSGLFPHCPVPGWAPQGQTQELHGHSRPGGAHCVCVWGGAREQARFHPARTQYSLSRSWGIRRGRPRKPVHLSLGTSCQLSLPQQSPILRASSWSTYPLMVAPGEMLSSQVVAHFLLPRQTSPTAVLWLAAGPVARFLVMIFLQEPGTEERLWLPPGCCHIKAFRVALVEC